MAGASVGGESSSWLLKHDLNRGLPLVPSFGFSSGELVEYLPLTSRPCSISRWRRPLPHLCIGLHVDLLSMDSSDSQRSVVGWYALAISAAKEGTL